MSEEAREILSRSLVHQISQLQMERDALRAELTLKEAVGNELNHAIANNRALNKYIDELLAELNGYKNGTEAKNI